MSSCARRRDFSLGRADARWAASSKVVFIFPSEFVNVYSMKFSSWILIICSKLCSGPKIVKPILLGLENYHLLVSIVRLQLAVIRIGS